MKYSTTVKRNEDYLYILAWNDLQDISLFEKKKKSKMEKSTTLYLRRKKRC